MLPGRAPALRESFRKRCGSRSSGMPRPTSATEKARSAPSRATRTSIGEPSGEFPGGVGEQVAQHLNDPAPIGHHGRELRLEVHAEVAPRCPAEEPLPGLVDDRGDLARPGFDGERAGLDAGHVEQVPDQVVHLVRRVADDAEELRHLGGIELGRGLQERRDRALDGGERGPELVAHHPQELRAQLLQILERRHVLQGDDDRLDAALLGADRRRVEQRADAAAARDAHDDLLEADDLAGAEEVREREVAEGDLASVRPHERQHVQELFRRLVGLPEVVDDACRLPVERLRRPRPGIEDDDADRGGVDQGLEIGASPLFVPVRAGVRDDHRGVRGEHRQGLLVVEREVPAVLPLGDVDVADVAAAVEDRRSEEGHDGIDGEREAEPGEPHRPGVAVEIVDPERLGGAADGVEELPPLGKLPEPLGLLGGHPGGEEVLHFARIVRQGHDPVAGSRQRARRVENLLQHRVEVEALVDAPAGLAEARETLPQPGDLRGRVVSWVHLAPVGSGPPPSRGPLVARGPHHTPRSFDAGTGRYAGHSGGRDG